MPCKRRNMPYLGIMGQFVNHISILHLLDLPSYFVNPIYAKTVSEKSTITLVYGTPKLSDGEE